MEVEIQVPAEVPVMTLPDVAFFPQALMPLLIFEPRYRRMLRDVLATNRIFAVAGLDSGSAEAPGRLEPPHRIACVGIVRACQTNDDGTSNLLLQGLCRVAIEAIVRDEPYRRVRIRALASTPGAAPRENARLRSELSRLIKLRLKLTPSAPGDMADLMKSIEDPEIFADMAAFSLCDSAPVKQRLLETLDVNRRLVMLLDFLRSDVDAAILRASLQRGLPDDEVSRN